MIVERHREPEQYADEAEAGGAVRVEQWCHRAIVPGFRPLPGPELETVDHQRAMAQTDKMRTAILELSHAELVATAVGYRTFDETPGDEVENTTTSSAGPYWGATGTQSYDEARFFLVTDVTDAFGNTTTVDYDAHALFAVAVTDPLSNTVAADIDY
jgi:YD repeat-containing protein